MAALHEKVHSATPFQSYTTACDVIKKTDSLVVISINTFSSPSFLYIRQIRGKRCSETQIIMGPVTAYMNDESSSSESVPGSPNLHELVKRKRSYTECNNAMEIDRYVNSS